MHKSSVINFSALCFCLIGAACVNIDSSPAVVTSDVCDTIQRTKNEVQTDFLYAREPLIEAKFKEIIQLYEQDKDAFESCPNAPSLAELQINLGLAMSNQQKFILAAEQFSNAREEIAQENDSTQELQILRTAEAIHVLNRASVNAAIEDTEIQQTAYSDIETLIAMSELADLTGLNTEEEYQLIVEANKLIVLAYDNFRNKNFAALDQINLAEKLINPRGVGSNDITNGAPYLYPQVLSLKSKIQLQQGLYGPAIDSIDAAIELLESRVDASPKLANMYLTKGLILSRQGTASEAVEAYNTGIKLYADFPAPVRLQALAPYFDLQYERWVTSENNEQILSDMFYAAQIIRSISASNDISQATASLTDVSGTNSRAREAILDWQKKRAQLNNLKSDLEKSARRDFGLVDDTDRLIIEKRIAQIQSEVDKLRREISKLAPEYDNALDKPLELDEIKSKLDSNEGLAYFVFPSKTNTDADGDLENFGLMFFVSNTKAYVSKISDSAKVAEDVAFVFARSQFLESGQLRRFPVKTASEVFVSLFGERLASDILAQRLSKLTIIPTGSLVRFPFGALVTNLPTDKGELQQVYDEYRKNRYARVSWLTNSVDLTYALSPRIFTNIRSATATTSPANNVLLSGGYIPGVDVSDWMKKNKVNNDCRPYVLALDRAAPLPGSIAEVNGIAQSLREQSGNMVTATALTGDDFTDSALKGRTGLDLSSYNILHFATHGLFFADPSCGEEPALTTTARSDLGNEQTPGLLTLTEIRKLRMNADLVVLSACNATGTLVSDNKKGRALADAQVDSSLTGFARAFFLSGVDGRLGTKSIVATHWAVEDKATTDLMVDFYKNLTVPNTSVSTALRQAQAVQQQNPERSHPAFWGAFVVIGNGDLAPF